MNIKNIAAGLVLSAGLITGSTGAAQAWLHHGPTTQYPSSGGTWQYGFWDVKVRSYYTVNKCHGSSVKLNGDLARSANTASGQRSIAEKWAVDAWFNDDAYYYRTC